MMQYVAKISKSLDMNFISIEKHETTICEFLFFRSRESLSTINILIPTPPSDCGGPDCPIEDPGSPAENQVLGPGGPKGPKEQCLP